MPRNNADVLQRQYHYKQLYSTSKLDSEVLDPRVRYETPLPPQNEAIFFNLFQVSLFQSSIIDDWEMHLVNMVL